MIEVARIKENQKFYGNITNEVIEMFGGPCTCDGGGYIALD